MPTINVKREQLFAEIGRRMEDEAFDEFCFEFGIELDEVTSERRLIAKEQGEAKASELAAGAEGLSDEVLYRIEVPANRYDLLSVEGLARAIRAFLGNPRAGADEMTVARDTGLCVLVAPETRVCRPYIGMALLRGVQMTPEVYASLIDLQEKLHGGLGRKRTIVSMGTYDAAHVALGASPSAVAGRGTSAETRALLEGLEARVRTGECPGVSQSSRFLAYDAVAPADVRLVPLNRGPAEVDGAGLVALLETDLQLRRVLPIVRDLPRWPVLRDAEDRLLSAIPILNADGCRIGLSTRDILIDVTGVDENKVGIALNMLVTTFARYSESVEAVRTVYLGASEDALGGASAGMVVAGSAIVKDYPQLASWELVVSTEYICRLVGVKLEASEICALLHRMMLSAQPSSTDVSQVVVRVPAIRPDVMHACDVMEDVAIAYGFNRVPARVPTTSTIGQPQPMNALADALRRETALAGWTEVLTFSLCSAAENYALLGRADPGSETVRLANPKTAEFEVVQTTLLPAMLKTLASNRRQPLPLRIFQVADVVLQDATADVLARNERRLCAAFCGMTSGLEATHGLLDRLMQMLAVPQDAWSIEPSEQATFFPGRQARVLYRGKPIGSFGIVHPDVMSAFDAPHVCSVLEFSIEPFL